MNPDEQFARCVNEYNDCLEACCQRPRFFQLDEADFKHLTSTVFEILPGGDAARDTTREILARIKKQCELLDSGQATRFNLIAKEIASFHYACFQASQAKENLINYQLTSVSGPLWHLALDTPTPIATFASAASGRIGWPSTWPPLLDYATLKAHSRHTETFVRFYKDVTASIEDFIKTLSQQAERNFLHFLCFGFWLEYEKWIRPPLLSFLQQVHANAIRPLEVACQAFLHMAYDLPRVIADALVATPPPEPDKLRAEHLFLKIDGTFAAPLRAQFKSFSAMGPFAIVARVVPKQLEIQSYAVLWVLNIRSRAFHHGAVLARAEGHSKARRQQIEDELQKAVTNSALEVLKNKHNPVAWLTILKSPSIGFPILLPLLIAPASLQLTGEVSLTALGVIAVIVAVTYRNLLTVLDQLGSHIQKAAIDVMRRAALEMDFPYEPL